MKYQLPQQVPWVLDGQRTIKHFVPVIGEPYETKDCKLLIIRECYWSDNLQAWKVTTDGDDGRAAKEDNAERHRSADGDTVPEVRRKNVGRRNKKVARRDSTKKSVQES